MDTQMTGYTMAWLENSGKTELWGTNTKEYLSSQATVYSDHARLTIQLLNPAGGPLSWDPTEGEWTGSGVSRTDFKGGCWEGADGPGGYSAEINVSGKAIYGYNWDVRNLSSATPGVYRITFSLDADNGTGTLNTDFIGAQVLRPDEGEELLSSMAAGGGGGVPGGGGTAYIDAANNLTYIDVKINAGGGGRR